MKSNKNLFRSGIFVFVWILFLFLNVYANLEISLLTINIILLTISLLYFFFLGGVWEKKRDRNKTYQVLVFGFSIYYIFYFGACKFFGYKSFYNGSFLTVCNLFLFLFFLDTLRNRFVKQGLNQKILACLCALLTFTVFLSFFSIFTLDGTLTFLMICILESFLLTNIAFAVGIRPIFVYRLITLFPIFILSMVPKISFFLLGSSFILFLFFIWVILKKEYEEEKDLSLKRNNSLLFPLVTVSFIVILLLTTGKLNYQLYAIASDSMKPEFGRGDVVLFKRLKEDQVRKIEVGDIIIYKTKERMIVHRVVEKQIDGNNYYFITKGDANELIDEKRIKKSDIIGVVKTHISYLGYPTVWINELLKGV